MSDITRENFVGAWKLQAWTVMNINTGRSREAFQGNAEGHILYTPDGWVSATLMEKGRAGSTDRMAINKLKMTLQADKNMSFDEGQLNLLKEYFLIGSGYVAYCGSFDVSEGQVHHHVSEALLPNMIGTTLTRAYEFSGSVLTLTANENGLEDKLVWERS